MPYKKKNHNYFSVNTDLYKNVKDLSNEQLGAILRACFEYSTSGKYNISDDITSSIFPFFKSEIDRSMEKQEKISKRNRENGKKGGRPPKPEIVSFREKELADKILNEIQDVCYVFTKLTGNRLKISDKYIYTELKTLIMRYGVQLVINAIKEALSSYEDPEIALSKIHGVCYCLKNPEAKEANIKRGYIYGILSNKAYPELNYAITMRKLKSIYNKHGIDGLENVEEWAKNLSSYIPYTEIFNSLDDFSEEQ